MLLPVLLIAAALQQPQQRPAPGAAVGQREAAGYDTSLTVVNRVGLKVAYVKSGLELYRRAVFNGADGEVLNTSDNLRQQCRALDSTAAAAPRKICRRCGSPAVAAALRRYEQILPSVARVGAQCASRIAYLARQRDAAKRLRAEVRVIGNRIVAGFAPYEQRVSALLLAVEGRAPASSPRRPGTP